MDETGRLGYMRETMCKRVRKTWTIARGRNRMGISEGGCGSKSRIYRLDKKKEGARKTSSLCAGHDQPIADIPREEAADMKTIRGGRRRPCHYNKRGGLLAMSHGYLFFLFHSAHPLWPYAGWRRWQLMDGNKESEPQRILMKAVRWRRTKTKAW